MASQPHLARPDTPDTYQVPANAHWLHEAHATIQLEVVMMMNIGLLIKSHYDPLTIGSPLIKGAPLRRRSWPEDQLYVAEVCTRAKPPAAPPPPSTRPPSPPPRLRRSLPATGGEEQPVRPSIEDGARDGIETASIPVRFIHSPNPDRAFPATGEEQPFPSIEDGVRDGIESIQSIPATEERNPGRGNPIQRVPDSGGLACLKPLFSPSS
ncbi:hypothetical protein CFC21_067874 [Triticum aestivum]|uniref:Uncharacterized protein n=2 Tax=Triticum aestivum TaxID=4565 RepID=A0A3B6KQA0_WHEAT|nr:hypothetical protein CFC21_067874 [Triticum aestivum]